MGNMDAHASLRERVLGERGLIMLIGAADSGKTSLARHLVDDAVSSGLSTAYVDGDVGAATVGPPSCAGLRFLESPADLATLHQADELRFVGSTHAEDVVLPHVVALASLVERAQRRAEFVVLDTSDVVAGVIGQTIKYHLMELCRPSLVIALQRGAEMEPIVAMLKRFLGARVARAEPEEDHQPLDPVTRHDLLRKAFADALAPPLDRWRVHSSVFAPTLPEGFDQQRLHGMLVGVQDDAGRCQGLGALEHEGATLRVATRYGDQMAGLRLGSLRIDLDTYQTRAVRLRQLFFGI